MISTWLVRLWLCLLLSGLMACSSRLPLPAQAPLLQGVELPLQLHLRYQEAELSGDALLVIQREEDGLRFSLFDALGVPKARQILKQGRWYADGLLPPNPQARQWFAALLFALTPDQQLLQQYPDATQTAQQRDLSNGWQVQYSAERHWQIIFNSQHRLAIEQMEWQP